MPNHDTPPVRPRPQQFAAPLDRCRGCNMVHGHRASCPELAAIRRTVADRAHAVRHWVRALTVRAAEKTMRGPAECWFAMHNDKSGRAPRRV